MHYICAPVNIRAEQYAAALGLPASAWRGVSTEPAARGMAGHMHILPGTSDDIAVTARRVAAKSQAYHLVDLTGIR